MAPYLAEWLDFHVAAGVERFFIYENGSTDATPAMLASGSHAGRITVIPWKLGARDAGTGRVFSQQVTAYAHAITTFGRLVERMAFIDIDEFLVPRGDRTLMEELHAIGPVANISLPWMMFGHGGHAVQPEGGVVANYTRRAATPYGRGSSLLRFKCIVDPCDVTGVGVHAFATRSMGERSANTRGEVALNRDRKRPDFFSDARIQLNHYYCLSEEELHRKCSRGPVNFASDASYGRRVRRKVAEIERATVEDRAAPDFLARVGRSAAAGLEARHVR
ncbi:glycosyltransferase family 92 protein [Rhodovulum sp. ES.010]|uniref:glycosyltransferase family 92 protein n=1 Tax=Rhodovulum sp. ES.010 TaxID=1882821 RepID=UPI0015880166|nr:glycosyltransferase family 92 protein [Rhodovulum sp. ES.010]